MKILNVTKFYLPVQGGQATYIGNLLKILRNSGHEGFVLQPYSKFNEPNVYKLKHVPIIWKFIDSWFIFNLQLFLKRWFIKRYQIVISHYPFHYPVLKWHKKLIVLSHGLDWHQPAVSKADKFRERTAKMIVRNECFLVANDSNFLRNIGFKIPPAEGFFNEIAPNKWFIPNCVDISLFRDYKKPRDKVILVPRTIRPERGIHLAIEAFNLFSTNHPDYRMEIVGLYDPRWNYFKQCSELVRNLELNDKIKFMGGVEWEKLPSFYNHSMITLIPTIEMEGTSLSALESMACGTPVISTNAGGLCDLPTVKSEPCAMDFSSKMEEVLLDWGKLSIYQLNEVREVFNLDKWSQVWLKVIEKVQNSKDPNF